MEGEQQPLLTPLKVGDLEFRNRVVMCALTRMRADRPSGVANDLMAEYYSARAATAGMVLTECSSVSPDGNSFFGSASIYNDEHVEGWKKVVDAVHAKGGLMVLQIWHGGRASHPDNLGGVVPISASAIAINGTIHTAKGRVPHEVPREATIEDIKKLVSDFRKGAENAKKAGFDGLELHGANGYIIDQFLRDGSNKRTDDYGGSVENRARLLLEVIDQLVEVYGPGRVGIKLSPLGDYNDMYDSDPEATYSYVLEQLSKRNIAFVEVMEGQASNPDRKKQLREKVFGDKKEQTLRELLRGKFTGAWIANSGFTRETGNEAIASGFADAVSYGNLYAQNEDLVGIFERKETPVGLPYDSEVYTKHIGTLFGYYYGSTPVGYTDISVYPKIGKE